MIHWLQGASWVGFMLVLWAGPIFEVVYWDLRYTPSGWDRSRVPAAWKWCSGCIYLGALAALLSLPFVY